MVRQRPQDVVAQTSILAITIRRQLMTTVPAHMFLTEIAIVTEISLMPLVYVVGTAKQMLMPMAFAMTKTIAWARMMNVEFAMAATLAAQVA